jgi:Photosynthetic reaction centre cytochrome C subunit
MTTKVSSLSVLMAALIPAVGVLTASPILQAAQNMVPAPAGDQPKNLKVLSKDLTMRQVREIMDGWSDALGADCGTCHVRDTANPTGEGRPHYNYADDSKQEKRTARVMYEMTVEINSRFISTVPNSGVPVTCGTCHRGRLSPAPLSSEDGSAPGKTNNAVQP